MRKAVIAGVLAIGAAGAALAHQGATGVVKARMDGMGVQQTAMKTLGAMARGQADFDANAAAAAFAAVAEAGRHVPAQFEVQDLSSPSEALPAIWENWDDFVAKSAAMVRAADLAPADLAELRAGLGAVGQTCSACHEVYREPQ